MRKLILKCGLSPGDIIMLTAAVRDLHCCYPKQFITDVRTCCSELWENNPHLTPLVDGDPDAETLDCLYPLINRCNETPYHCLHGFVEFLNERLKLSIKPTAFKGDIHLSEQEKLWYSQVHELTRQDTPFWIVAAGGKYDIPIKWWDTERYQEVVNHFLGRIQFVQVGETGHHHPKLEGAIDLRGRTTLRELVRLVHHSQGVLCSITALMHLAAAVETKLGSPPVRPCVVVAGGREPAHWEAYAGHQFIHTGGALSCCSSGGCWKDRPVRLRDGDPRDRRQHRCVNLVGALPRCMDLITAREVIRRIEMYYAGGALKYLSARQNRGARRAVTATRQNAFDSQALNLHSAGMACDRFIGTIPGYPGGYQGRGIIICGGGVRYFTSAWVCIRMLRRLGCTLPIQLWHLGKAELDEHMKSLVARHGVECVDACKIRKRHPARILHGWELKPFAILHSPFREVLFLDADNVPVRNPEFLFQTLQFKKAGAVFWPDYSHSHSEKTIAVWRSCGVRAPNEPEFETGQILLDKERVWDPLCLTMWLNENSDFYYQYLHGDKETFHIAFRKLRQDYALIQTPIETLPGTMCQHDFEGQRLFQHRNTDKWDLFLNNKTVPGFQFEKDCKEYVRELRLLWNGKIGSKQLAGLWSAKSPMRNGHSLTIEAVMISCPKRNDIRVQTLRNFAGTDWGEEPWHIEIDSSVEEDPRERQTRCALLALQKSLERNADYMLFLEDDLDFNRHIRHNLYTWQPVRTKQVGLASIYNPTVREKECDFESNSRLVLPNSIYGSQALLLSKDALKYVVRNWNRVSGMQDIRISRLIGRRQRAIPYHAPSLVQHMGNQSTWSVKFHQAMDFDPDWKA